jgi:hypothetical protein
MGATGYDEGRPTQELGVRQGAEKQAGEEDEEAELE